MEAWPLGNVTYNRRRSSYARTPDFIAPEHGLPSVANSGGASPRRSNQRPHQVMLRVGSFHAPSWPRGRPTKVTPARHVVGTMRRCGAPSRGARRNVSMTNANFPSAVRAAGTWNTARDGVSGARITTAITRAARAGGASSCAASTRAGTAYVRVPIRKELQHGRLGRQPALDGTRYAALNALGPLASPPRAHSPKAPHWPERYRHAFSVTMAASSKLRQALPKTPSRQSLRSPYYGTLDS